MELKREEFPIALQAYEVRGEGQDFVAEQVVNSQVEADNFMTMYSGRLIKTREVRPVETKKVASHRPARARGAIPAWIIILAILIILFVVAYATGWLQTLIQQVK